MKENLSPKRDERKPLGQGRILFYFILFYFLIGNKK